jgi:hypothetical protein
MPSEPVYQTSGRFRLINGVWTNKATDEEVIAWRTEEEKKKQAMEAADEKRRADQRALNKAASQQAHKDALKAANEDLANAEARFKRAQEALAEADKKLNQTLASARVWLKIDEGSELALEAVGFAYLFTLVEAAAVGRLGLVGLGALPDGEVIAKSAQDAAKVAKAVHTFEKVEKGAELADRGAMVKHGKEFLELANKDGFPPVDQYMSPETIEEYGRRLDEVANENNFEGAQVVAEGRSKLRKQFADAAEAKKEEAAASDDLAKVKADQIMANDLVEMDSAANGVQVLPR